MEHVIMTQRDRGAAYNLSQKGRSWYLAKYRRENPKKEGVDIWEVQTAKPQKGRSWSLTKV